MIAIAIVGATLYALIQTQQIQHRLAIPHGILEFIGVWLEAAAAIFAIATIFDGNAIREHLLGAVRRLTNLEEASNSSVGSLRTLETDLQSLEQNLQGLGKDLKREIETVANLQVGLLEIKNSLSTRSIGTFPKYLPEIRHNIAHAQKTLRIMCDFIGHGSFTAPAAWDAIQKDLEARLLGQARIGSDAFAFINPSDCPAKGVKLDLVFASSDRRNELFLQECPALASDSEWE